MKVEMNGIRSMFRWNKVNIGNVDWVLEGRDYTGD
jgi:hypothetical protein